MYLYYFSLIYDNIVLVSRALRNQFIIPDWESFTLQIRGFYDKVKAMDSVGHVSTVERLTDHDDVTQPTNLTYVLLSRGRPPARRMSFSGTFYFCLSCLQYVVIKSMSSNIIT